MNSSENERFYSREILLFIAWACLRNAIVHIKCLTLYCCISDIKSMIYENVVRHEQHKHHV